MEIVAKEVTLPRVATIRKAAGVALLTPEKEVASLVATAIIRRVKSIRFGTLSVKLIQTCVMLSSACPASSMEYPTSWTA